MDGRKHRERTRFNTGSAYHSVSILSDLVLHRRRHHVDLHHGDCLESGLRLLQQAMAAETEKEKKLHQSNGTLKFSGHALFRRDQQLLIFQRDYHG